MKNRKFNVKIILVVIAVLCLTFIVTACNKANEKVVTSPIYEINLCYDGDRTVKATQNVCYFNNSDGDLTEIVMALYANAYSESGKPFTAQHVGAAYYDGLSYGGIEIKSLTVEKEKTDFTVSDTKMSFKIPTLSSGKSVNLSLEYEITLPLCNGRLGKTKDSVNLSGFYPQICPLKNGQFVCNEYSALGDPFCSEIGDFFINVTLPSEYKIATSGKITEAKEIDAEPKKIDYEIIAEKTRDFGLVASTALKSLSADVDGVTVIYDYLSDPEPETSLKIAESALTTFSTAFGKYPYSTYTVCETPFVHKGMEFSTLAMIDDKMTPKERELTIIHETAHQWWYGVVGSNQFDEAFLDEGLAEFSTAYYYKATGDTETFSQLIKSHKANYQLFSEYSAADGSTFDGKMSKRLCDFSSENDYIVTAYDEGTLAFNSVYEIMGEKKFLKAAKKYFKDNAFKIATVDNFKNAIDKYSKQAGKTLNAWLDGTVKL